MQGLLGKGRWINIEPTVGNEVALTSRQRHLSTSGYQHCQQNANVGPPTDCYLGCPELTTNVYVTYARSYS